MNRNLSLSLKLLSIYFWFYTPVFVLSILPQGSSSLGRFFVREAQIVNWEFELLFALLFFIWGAYLWIASGDPMKYRFFVSFTIWTTIAHILWMVFVAMLNTADTVHLLKDAFFLAVPLVLILWFRSR